MNASLSSNQSSSSSSSSQNVSESPWPETNFSVTTYVVLSCVIASTGIVGNSVLMIVLLITKKSSSMNSLLLALTFTDVVYLAGSLSVVFLYDVAYLYNAPMRFSFVGVMATWIILFFVRWSQLAGVWITVQISFERWLAISRPLNRHMSVRKTQRLSAVLIAVCILYEIPGCFSANPACSSSSSSSNGPQPDVNRSSSSRSKASWLPVATAHDSSNAAVQDQSQDGNDKPCKLAVASWATGEYAVFYTSVSYAILSFAVPLVAVASFSLLTLRKIKQVRQESIRLRNTSQSHVQIRQTVRVLLLSAMFLLFEVPSLICRTIQNFGLTDSTYFTADDLYVAAAVCAILYATCNFVLYCICSKRFRRLTRSLLCQYNYLPHRHTPSLSVRRRTSSSAVTTHKYESTCVETQLTT